MTPEQKIIAIAEFEGFIEDEPWMNGRRCWIRKEKPAHIGYEESDIPPYLTSRDAICGAVARLDNEQFRMFVVSLEKTTGCKSWWESMQSDDMRRILLATPAQLADALLLTLGYEI